VRIRYGDDGKTVSLDEHEESVKSNTPTIFSKKHAIIFNVD